MRCCTVPAGGAHCRTDACRYGSVVKRTGSASDAHKDYQAGRYTDLEIYMVVATGDSRLPQGMQQGVDDVLHVVPGTVALAAMGGFAPTASEVKAAFGIGEESDRTGMVVKLDMAAPFAGYADNTIWEKLRKWRTLGT